MFDGFDVVYIIANIVMNIMFIITATVEYLFFILYSNFLLPIFNVHIPNISVNVNVNNIGVKPIKNPERAVIKTNMDIVFILSDIVHFINLEYHLDFIGNDMFFSGFVESKYPGIHRAENPKGILKIIFHNGI